MSELWPGIVIAIFARSFPSRWISGGAAWILVARARERYEEGHKHDKEKELT